MDKNLGGRGFFIYLYIYKIVAPDIAPAIEFKPARTLGRSRADTGTTRFCKLSPGGSIASGSSTDGWLPLESVVASCSLSLLLIAAKSSRVTHSFCHRHQLHSGDESRPQSSEVGLLLIACFQNRRKRQSLYCWGSCLLRQDKQETGSRAYIALELCLVYRIRSHSIHLQGLARARVAVDGLGPSPVFLFNMSERKIHPLSVLSAKVYCGRVGFLSQELEIQAWKHLLAFEDV